MKTLYLYFDLGDYTPECDNHMREMVSRLVAAKDVRVLEEKVREDLNGAHEAKVECSEWAANFLQFMGNCDMMVVMPCPFEQE